MTRAEQLRSAADPTPAGLLPQRVYVVLCSLMLAAAVALIGSYFAQSPPPPVPPGALGAIPAAMTGPAGNAESGTIPGAGAAGSFSMKPSPPVSVRASVVGIQSPLLQVGLDSDHAIEVPKSYSEAAWYKLGPTPGTLGAAVIIGHVDSFHGPGVFFNLGDIRPGQIIDVDRADKSLAHFRVDAVNRYSKDLFPTETVYGPINYAGLRLITCGGNFDEVTRSYDSNTVVFASLIHP